MKKEVTIFQMSADSIDVLDEIKVEVWVKEESYTPSCHWESEPLYNPAEVTEINYEGRIITNLLPMFTDEELIENDTLETETSLTSIKAITE